eukprot:XP_014034300.1 PREDICTED: serine/threonine-protein kinase 3-like [Salmo salar]
MEPTAPKSKLKKLSEDSLTKQPEEVFDVLEKLGEGSYGSVFKAIHKESGQVVAIKQVPVESDLQEIIKEISIMQQCDRYSVCMREDRLSGPDFHQAELAWLQRLVRGELSPPP